MALGLKIAMGFNADIFVQKVRRGTMLST